MTTKAWKTRQSCLNTEDIVNKTMHTIAAGNFFFCALVVGIGGPILLAITTLSSILSPGLRKYIGEYTLGNFLSGPGFWLSAWGATAFAGISFGLQEDSLGSQSDKRTCAIFGWLNIVFLGILLAGRVINHRRKEAR